MANITWKGYAEYLEHTAKDCIENHERRPDLYPSAFVAFIDKTSDANNFIIWGTEFFSCERDENGENPKLERAFKLRDKVIAKYFGDI